MIKWIREAWGWITAAVVAVGSFLLYGWWMRRQGAKRAKAKAKITKAEKEQKRAERLRDREGEREALEEADRLEERVRQRHEEAARELGVSEERVREMSDDELADALGGSLGPPGGG